MTIYFNLKTSEIHLTHLDASLYVDDLDPKLLHGKTVLMRVDFNVPIEGDRVLNDKRIRAALPTIQYLKQHGAKIVLMSHKGRPKGFDPKESLQPAATALSNLLETPVSFSRHLSGDFLKNEVTQLNPGQILLLENLRYRSEEEENQSKFSKELAGIADLYVNDAFGTAHRAHTSTEGVTHFLPAMGGFLIRKEIENLSQVLTRPRAGFTAIVGGAKISDKFKILERLIDRVETIVIGGAMANTFLKAQGHEMGTSLVEGEQVIKRVKAFLQQAEQKGVKIILPVDFAVAATKDPRKLSAEHPRKTVSADAVSFNEMALDIGEVSIQNIEEIIQNSTTVLWNGPMGYSEHLSFEAGTLRVAQAIAAQKARSDFMSVVGGGDSVTAIENAGIPEDAFTWVSTGGGASLEFLEGKTLPGIQALLKKGIFYRYLQFAFTWLLSTRYWYLLR